MEPYSRASINEDNITVLKPIALNTESASKKDDTNREVAENESELENDSGSENDSTSEFDLHQDELPGESDKGQINVRKRKKRRHVSTAAWEVIANKTQRQAGLQYFGKRKIEENKWDYRVMKSAKSIKERCHCDKKSSFMCAKISEEQRKIMFEKFWRFSWNEKKIYLTVLLVKHPSKRARHRKIEDQSRRQNSYSYFLEIPEGKLRVCKTIFCNTFSISPRTVGHWVMHNKENEINSETREENQDSTSTRGNCRQLEKRRLDPRRLSIKEKNGQLKNFFDSLPKMESHYCRKSSSKLYLEPIWTSKSELYRLYKEDWCKTNNCCPVSIAAFANMFSDMNLALFSPKKDECDTCVAYKTKNIDESTYKRHLLKKEEARTEKEADKFDENKIVFTMDLQSVLVAPKSNVSSLYYKTKLIVHNFTIFDLKSKDGYCFIWHEGQGNVSSDTFTSILYHFLLTQVLPQRDSFNEIILWSDGCTAQNRNATLSSALLNFSQQMDITIQQKYLEKGHTQMECDSIHSTIERRLKKRKINVPADYVDVLREARLNPRPYVVKYLDYTFFKNFKPMQCLNSIRPGRTIGEPTVTDLRALQYSGGEVKYKIRHPDEWKVLQYRLNRNRPQLNYSQLPLLNLSPVPIKAEKYKHLMDLKESLEKDYHSFYDSFILKLVKRPNS